jgi:phenylacetate-coenzyme A ligase PaaK-like adenylate-forming protein
VLVEPIDADGRPTPPGHISHSVLVTNLANRIQPVIRYDLGDAVFTLPGLCVCGNPLPAIRVHGRCDDIVRLKGVSGRELKLPPLALTTVLEEIGGIHRFQIVQRTPDCLALRIDASERAAREPALFARAARALQAYLDEQGAGHVRIVRDQHAPQRDSTSGKLRQVLATGKQT